MIRLLQRICIFDSHTSPVWPFLPSQNIQPKLAPEASGLTNSNPKEFRNSRAFPNNSNASGSVSQTVKFLPGPRAAK